jgi:hypothetical protein
MNALWAIVSLLLVGLLFFVLWLASRAWEAFHQPEDLPGKRLEEESARLQESVDEIIRRFPSS